MKTDQLPNIPFLPIDLLEIMTLFFSAKVEENRSGSKNHAEALQKFNEASSAWKLKWKGKPCPCCGKIVE